MTVKEKNIKKSFALHLMDKCNSMKEKGHYYFTFSLGDIPNVTRHSAKKYLDFFHNTYADFIVVPRVKGKKQKGFQVKISDTQYNNLQIYLNEIDNVAETKTKAIKMNTVSFEDKLKNSEIIKNIFNRLSMIENNNSNISKTNITSNTDEKLVKGVEWFLNTFDFKQGFNIISRNGLVAIIKKLSVNVNYHFDEIKSKCESLNVKNEENSLNYLISVLEAYDNLHFKELESTPLVNNTAGNSSVETQLIKKIDELSNEIYEKDAYIAERKAWIGKLEDELIRLDDLVKKYEAEMPDNEKTETLDISSNESVTGNFSKISKVEDDDEYEFVPKTEEDFEVCNGIDKILAEYEFELGNPKREWDELFYFLMNKTKIQKYRNVKFNELLKKFTWMDNSDCIVCTYDIIKYFYNYG